MNTAKISKKLDKIYEDLREILHAHPEEEYLQATELLHLSLGLVNRAFIKFNNKNDNAK